MKVKVKWEEMLSDEFETAMRKFPVCYMPVGTLERHGTHLPFGLDSLKAYHICLMAAERFGGIVTPPLYWGTHGFSTEEFKRSITYKQPPGSVYISEGLLFNLCMEMFREVAYCGFKVIAVFTGHYPTCHLNVLKRAAEQFMEESKVSVWAFKEPELSGEVEVGGDHAAKWETSLMMALRPELVDMEKAPPVDAGYFPYSGKSLHEASPETGRKAVEYIVEQIGAKCKELLALHEDD